MAYYRSGNITSAVTCFQAAIAQDSKLTEDKIILQGVKKIKVQKNLSKNIIKPAKNRKKKIIVFY